MTNALDGEQDRYQFPVRHESVDQKTAAHEEELRKLQLSLGKAELADIA